MIATHSKYEITQTCPYGCVKHNKNTKLRKTTYLSGEIEVDALETSLPIGLL